MKPTLKDYLSIALALLAIFLCGYGIGFMFGERKGQKKPLSTPPPAAPIKAATISAWEETTLAEIQRSVDLSPEQLEEVKAEIAKSVPSLQAARREAVATYQDVSTIELRALTERLKAHLTPEQHQKLPGASPD